MCRSVARCLAKRLKAAEMWLELVSFSYCWDLSVLLNRFVSFNVNLRDSAEWNVNAKKKLASHFQSILLFVCTVAIIGECKMDEVCYFANWSLANLTLFAPASRLAALIGHPG